MNIDYMTMLNNQKDITWHRAHGVSQEVEDIECNRSARINSDRVCSQPSCLVCLTILTWAPALRYSEKKLFSKLRENFLASLFLKSSRSLASSRMEESSCLRGEAVSLMFSRYVQTKEPTWLMGSPLRAILTLVSTWMVGQDMTARKAWILNSASFSAFW